VRLDPGGEKTKRNRIFIYRPRKREKKKASSPAGLEKKDKLTSAHHAPYPSWPKGKKGKGKAMDGEPAIPEQRHQG